MISRRQFLKLSVMLPLLKLPTSPNICLIMADDFCRNDLGCYANSLAHTPNIDTLASQGMRFLNAYAPCPKCSPTRWCLMTGRGMEQAHTLGNDSIILSQDRPTIAEWLKTQGYATAIVGKWGINNDHSDAGNHPNNCGFDRFFGFWDHGEAAQYYPLYIWQNGQKVPNTRYVLDLLIEDALGWISQASQPFFLYFPTPAVHANNDLASAGLNGFSETSINPIYANLDWPETEKHFASLITRMDNDIGRIISALPQNTITFFCSDNGPTPWGGHDINFLSSWDYRGTKDFVWEGGIRVPLIVHWPGWIQPGISEHPCLISDIYATLRDIL